MSIRVLAVGKRHDDWVRDGIDRFTGRLTKPFDLRWQFVPHSAGAEQYIRDDESQRMLAKLTSEDFVILLDERGVNLTSPAVSAELQKAWQRTREPTFVIGGAYGVSEALRARADLVWSLSNLVFPHQLVRLLLTEQIYRSQEIAAGRPYHHI